MATVRYFWHDFIHSCVPSNTLSILPNVWKASYNISATISVDVSYWPPYITDKFISCVVLDSSQWFFHFEEEIVIARTHMGWVRWMFQNLPLPTAREVRDSGSDMTPFTVMKNDGVLYHQVSPHTSRSPWKYSCVLRHHATSILFLKRCSSFVNMVLERSHYPYESQRSTHRSRLTVYCRRWLE